MKYIVLFVLLLVTVSGTVDALIFADGFESGDTCQWSRTNPQCGFCPDVNTVALWKMDEGSGQILSDASGNGRSLTLGPTSSVESDDPTWAPGRFGSGLFFDSSSLQYANGDHSNTFPSNELTIELWILPTGGSGNHGSAQVFTAGFINCAMVTSTQDNDVWIGIGDGSNWSSMTVDAGSVDLDDGAWHYLAMTYDGVTQALYIDGSLAGSQPVSTTLDSPNDYKVGGRIANSYLDGWMDEVRLSDVARTAAEISWSWAGAASCQ